LPDIADLGAGATAAPGCCAACGTVAGAAAGVEGRVATPAHPASNSSHAETKSQTNLFFN
jgi:hypothetical protein